MDDEQRIALVETRTVDTTNTDRAPAQLIRYQLGNHLGSASVELDDQARIISYEEYYPYGSTSYQAIKQGIETPKRYKYTGKEKDEESGFYYYGARYYISWLGRWLSPDPRDFNAGINLYENVTSNPISNIDPSGMQSEPINNLPKQAPSNLTNLPSHVSRTPHESKDDLSQAQASQSLSVSKHTFHYVNIRLLLARNAEARDDLQNTYLYRNAAIRKIVADIRRSNPSIKRYQFSIGYEIGEFSDEPRNLAATEGWAIQGERPKIFIGERAFSSVETLHRTVMHEIRHAIQRSHPSKYHHAFISFDEWLENIHLSSEALESSFSAMREFEVRLLDLEQRTQLGLSKRVKASYLVQANKYWQQLIPSRKQEYQERWFMVQASGFKEVSNYVPRTYGPRLQTVMGQRRLGDVPLLKGTYLTRTKLIDLLTQNSRGKNPVGKACEPKFWLMLKRFSNGLEVNPLKQILNTKTEKLSIEMVRLSALFLPPSAHQAKTETLWIYLGKLLAKFLNLLAIMYL